MRDGKPIEEVIYEIVEIVLTLLLVVLFLFVLITNGEARGNGGWRCCLLCWRCCAWW